MNNIHEIDPKEKRLNAEVALRIMHWGSDTREVEAPIDWKWFLDRNGRPRMASEWRPTHTISDAWEMEKQIAEDGRWKEYGAALVDVIGRTETAIRSDRYVTEVKFHPWDIAHAPPAKRVEAALLIYDMPFAHKIALAGEDTDIEKQAQVRILKKLAKQIDNPPFPDVFNIGEDDLSSGYVADYLRTEARLIEERP